jgi:NitT/TauT family transport system substrate-binding protein
MTMNGMRIAAMMLGVAPAAGPAAAIWVRVEKARLTPEAAADMVRRPENDWTTTPAGVMQFARLMAETGALQSRPEDWRDLFFATGHEMEGS